MQPIFDRVSVRLERELNLLEVSLQVLDHPFHTLSGGEQTKVLLAGLFLREDRFFDAVATRTIELT